jgi:hypothetical protein
LSSVTPTAKRPIGMLTKKIHFHDSPEVRMPPTTGPTATATPVMEPQMPKATPRSRPWKAWASRANDVENMIAPPIPCPARARISHSDDCASPQRSEPTVKARRPIVKRIRRPNRSARDPAVRRSDASVRA